MAHLINIVDITLLYTVVIYHIGTFNKCIWRIYNDIINCGCCTKCQHACVRVYSIVTVARAIQSMVVMGIHSAFSRKYRCVSILIYTIKLLINSINSCGHFCHSLKSSFAVFIFLVNKINFTSHSLKIIANAPSSQKFGQRLISTCHWRRPLFCVFMNGVRYKM